MVKSTGMSIIAAGLLIGLTTGCATVPGTVVRSQSPEKAKLLIHEQQTASQNQIVQTGGGTWTGESRARGELRGLVRSNLTGKQVTHHGYRTPVSEASCPTGNCNGAAGGTSPHWRYGNFDQQPCPSGGSPGWGNCPPSQQEQCWDHGGRRHRGQYHYHTYSYKKPNNLVYPQQNQPGGATTYPYYTHKGPSDFFWKGDGAL